MNSFVFQFSPNVALALQNKQLTGNQRSEFIRDICTHISSNGIYFLNKVERNQVATAIVTKYPHLKDPIGSGLVSFHYAICVLKAGSDWFPAGEFYQINKMAF